MKNDGTYFLLIKLPSGDVAKTYPETIYPFTWNDINLFVHRCIDVIHDDDSIEYSKSFWQISDKECGCNLMVEGATVIPNAKRQAIEKLEILDIGLIKLAIERGKKLVPA